VPGTTVVVIGAGGLGHLAIQLARAITPSRLIVVDIDDHKRAQALEFGADVAIAPDDDAEARIRDLTSGHGAELVLDLVGADTTLALAARTARVRGHLTVVGIAGGTLPFSFFGLPYECSVATTYWGSITELVEVLDLARACRIRADVERFPLEQALEAYDRMRACTLHGRAVITPN
jgi:propanol-preferring alcohol dehydrogenase